jgi:putative redox protein
VPETVIVRLNDRFRAVFSSERVKEDGVVEVRPVEGVHELTPYGMLMAGLGSCTALVIMTYARNHSVNLQSVELRLTYARVFDEDCVNCEHIDQYTEQIEEQISLFGELDDAEREKLFIVSKQCPVHKIIEDGIEINSSLVGATLEGS